MSDVVIRVENLSKKYTIGRAKGVSSGDGLRHAVQDAVTAPWRALGKFGKSKTKSPNGQSFAKIGSHHSDVKSSAEDFWALRDVSFEVRRGEVLGIIGQNGAGKSTLLKILSRITEPTSGRIGIKGRVASLLEVGTGFHPDLTGRENIFLNGAILGMTRIEIRRKFKEIVDFAEISKFLDTPVKHYSSGMYVRLAFSVAAYLDPEILLVDEVLAVGDAEFQKKCLGKIEDITSKAGRTVFFVSHNSNAVQHLCSSAVLLEKGRLVLQGTPITVLQRYSSRSIAMETEYNAKISKNTPFFQRIRFSQEDQNKTFHIDQPIHFQCEIETLGKRNLVVSIHIYNVFGVMLHHTTDEFDRSRGNGDKRKRFCTFPAYSLAAGRYCAECVLHIRDVQYCDEVKEMLAFEVTFVGCMSDRTAPSQWKGLCGPGLILWH